jgi:hypothetical protein
MPDWYLELTEWSQGFTAGLLTGVLGMVVGVVVVIVVEKFSRR